MQNDLALLSTNSEHLISQNAKHTVTCNNPKLVAYSITLLTELVKKTKNRKLRTKNMKGQKLLNNTLKVNAAFSLFSGIDFIFFDKRIGRILSGGDFESLAPTGFILIGFAIFVLIVSMLKRVNKYLVGAIIAMDVLWVIGSTFVIAMGFATFTTIGLLLIPIVAVIIALFAFLQTKGLRTHLQST